MSNELYETVFLFTSCAAVKNWPRIKTDVFLFSEAKYSIKHYVCVKSIWHNAFK